jgi:AcrR family transcriptional regulator
VVHAVPRVAETVTRQVSHDDGCHENTGNDGECFHPSRCRLARRVDIVGRFDHGTDVSSMRASDNELGPIPTALMDTKTGVSKNKRAPKPRAHGDKIDTRTERTQKKLRDALLSLLHERGWDATNVRDVCARAGVGRSTFYTHFADKEELLASGFKDLKRTLRAQSGDRRPLAFARALFAHAEENQKLLRRFIAKPSSQGHQRSFRALVAELVGEDLARLDLPQRDAAVCALAGALSDLVLWQLRVPGSKGAELTETFRRLGEGVITST